MFIVASLLISAHAWHSGMHFFTGIVAEETLSEGSRTFFEKVLQSGADCNELPWLSIHQSTTFPDDIKAFNSNTTDWHWNDLSGHLSFANAANSIQTLEPVDVKLRNQNNANCEVGTGDCYANSSDTAVGMRNNGELRSTLLDFDNAFVVPGAKPSTQRQDHNPVVNSQRSWATRNWLHYFGDSHCPVHNGSMYASRGLDVDTCMQPSFAGTDAADGIVPGDKLMDKRIKQSCRSHRATPNLWCRLRDDIDANNGSEGDRGSNFVFVSPDTDDSVTGNEVKIPSTTNLHALWDTGFYAFHDFVSNEADKEDADPYALCNTSFAQDGTGTVKSWQFSYQEYNADGVVQDKEGVGKVADTGIQHLNSRINPMNYEVLKCHVDLAMAEFPRDTIQAKIKTLVESVLSDYGITAPAMDDSFFSPQEVHPDPIQTEMNYIRQYAVYGPYFMDDSKLEGAGCQGVPAVGDLPEVLGGAPMPHPKFRKNSRELARALGVLNGYRMAAKMDSIYVKADGKYFQPAHFGVCNTDALPDRAVMAVGFTVVTALIALVL